LGLFSFPALCQDVKEYKVAKVTKTAPVIDGNYTEDEWAGSTWTGEFYGLWLDPNFPEYQGAKIDSVQKIQWRALWDEDYFYFLITSDVRYLNPNGETYTGTADPLAADDTGYAGWGGGTNIDYEVFIVPQWTEDLGNVGEASGSGPAGYQLCYFPIKAGADPATAPSNFGTRGEVGPPFFHTGYSGNGTFLPGAEVVDPAVPARDWKPVYTAATAQAKGVKPLLLSSQPHEIAGTTIGTDVVAKPVLEIAFPFSQFSYPACPLTFTYTDPDTGEEKTETRDATKDDVPFAGGANVLLEKDAQGHWVKAGDKWLINICAYTDGATSTDLGVTYITWNELQTGGFHNWPKGMMIFQAPVNVGGWMLY